MLVHWQNCGQLLDLLTALLARTSYNVDLISYEMHFMRSRVITAYFVKTVSVYIIQISEYLGPKV